MIAPSIPVTNIRGKVLDIFFYTLFYWWDHCLYPVISKLHLESSMVLADTKHEKVWALTFISRLSTCQGIKDHLYCANNSSLCLNTWKLYFKIFFGPMWMCGKRCHLLELPNIQRKYFYWYTIYQIIIGTLSQKWASSTDCTPAGVAMSLSPTPSFCSDHHNQWHLSIFTTKLWDNL